MTASDRWPAANWLALRCPACGQAATIAEASRARYEGSRARVWTELRCPGCGHTAKARTKSWGAMISTGEALHHAGLCQCCDHDSPRSE